MCSRWGSSLCCSRPRRRELAARHGHLAVRRHRDRDPFLPTRVRSGTAHVQHRPSPAEPGRSAGQGHLYFLRSCSSTCSPRTYPSLGVAVRAIPWFARDLALPAVGATRPRVDPPGGSNVSSCRPGASGYCVGPRHLAGLRPLHRWDGAGPRRRSLILPDGSDRPACAACAIRGQAPHWSPLRTSAASGEDVVASRRVRTCRVRLPTAARSE